METDGNFHGTILNVPGIGRYVWTEALGLVDFTKPNKRWHHDSIALRDNLNTHRGAIRAAARHLERMMKEQDQ